MLYKRSMPLFLSSMEGDRSQGFFYGKSVDLLRFVSFKFQIENKKIR